MWTASLLVYTFDPNSNNFAMVWNEQLAQSDQMIFINSVIQGEFVYFFTKNYCKHKLSVNNENIEICLKRLNLDRIRKGAEALKISQIYLLKRKVNEITSLIMSSIFQEGKDIE